MALKKGRENQNEQINEYKQILYDHSSNMYLGYFTSYDQTNLKTSKLIHALLENKSQRHLHQVNSGSAIAFAQSDLNLHQFLDTLIVGNNISLSFIQTLYLCSYAGRILQKKRQLMSKMSGKILNMPICGTLSVCASQNYRCRRIQRQWLFAKSRAR